MLQIEITFAGPLYWGFKRYRKSYSGDRVCLFDLGFVQIKILRRTNNDTERI